MKTTNKTEGLNMIELGYTLSDVFDMVVIDFETWYESTGQHIDRVNSPKVLDYIRKIIGTQLPSSRYFGNDPIDIDRLRDTLDNILRDVWVQKSAKHGIGFNTPGSRTALHNT